LLIKIRDKAMIKALKRVFGRTTLEVVEAEYILARFIMGDGRNWYREVHPEAREYSAFTPVASWEQVLEDLLSDDQPLFVKHNFSRANIIPKTIDRAATYVKGKKVFHFKRRGDKLTHIKTETVPYEELDD